MVTVAAAGLAAAAGCSDGGSSGSASPGDVVTLEMEPWQVAAGEDRIWCKTMKVPSDVTLDVSKFTITMPAGSHHFILYRSDSNVPDGFGDCDGMDRTFVVGSQTYGEFEVAYPEGLALPLFAGEQLVLESHYSNASSDPITATVTVDLHTIAHDQVEDYLQTVLVPYSDFSIPPNTTGYVDGMTVPEFAGYNVLSMSSHGHKRLKRFTVDRTVAGSAGTTRVYESTDWESPEITEFTPPLAGQSGNELRFECTWDNETNQPIGFGSTTEDEMCIMVLTFFPAYSYSP